MWQRIQTVYLVLAIVCCMVCLCMPVASIVAAASVDSTGMQPDGIVYNFFTVLSDGTREWSMFSLESFLLIMSCTFAAIAIFTYKNRKLQAVECALGIVFTLIWNVIYGVWAFSGLIDNGGEMKPSFAACLPLVALILFVLARKGILKDEALVRAADRIR